METEVLKKSKIYAIAILLIGTGFLPTCIVLSTAHSSSPATNHDILTIMDDDTEYWALLVAVGVYADDPQQNRPDMLLEVDDLHALLLQSEWWHEDHIKVIKGEDATVSNIIAGLRWLDRMDDGNDISLVYITTHGFPLPFDIPPKDEEDGFDEALASYWQFAYSSSVIYDDELNFLLNRLDSKGVCLIVDSCYAGGFNDPPNWNITSTLPPSDKNIQQSAAEWIQGFGTDVMGQNRVVLMASREDEVSYSGGFGPYLIDGLRGYADINGDGIVTAEEAFYYAQPRSPRQTPTIYDGFAGELPLTTVQAQTYQPAETSERIRKTTAPSSSPMFSSVYSSTICGYVTDANTQTPLQASIYVQGRINQYEYYTNQTTTDASGFYSMNVPAIRLRVTASAQGYCDRTVGPYQIYENQTVCINLSLFPRPAETAQIHGFIVDGETAEPLSLANVTLIWQGSEGQSYLNNTITDITGHYHLNVAAGTLRLQIEKQGYFSKSIDDIFIDDFEILWFNISLNPRPLENAEICGYITDQKTGVPLADARVDIQWMNVDLGYQYSKETRTNTSGFYSINIAAGEVYINVRRQGYEYYDPYRHDAIEETTIWINKSLPPETIEVEIAKPLRALYLNNQRLMPFTRARIIGPITVEAYVPGGWNQQGQAQKIEFYVDDVLQETVSTQPYNWTWTKMSFGKHIIKVIAYDYNGDTASKEIQIRKFL